MTRYLIVGATGMLGADFVDKLAGRDVTALGRADLDVTDTGAVADAVAGYDVVLNASAYTKVDDAETNEELAYAVNALGAANLARAAAATGAILVQVSTDYVFDGTATSPYSENTPVNPVSAYGRTKAEGERLAQEANPDRTIIARTAWLYGGNGANFPKTMLRLARERDTVDVVSDQVGQPTWTADLAGKVVELLDAGVTSGTFHATNSGETSWLGFAQAVFELGGFDPQRVKPTDSASFVRPAPRPAYSVLGHDAWDDAGLSPMRPWREALGEAFATGALGAE